MKRLFILLITSVLLTPGEWLQAQEIPKPIKEGRFEIMHNDDLTLSISYAGLVVFESVEAGYTSRGRDVWVDEYLSAHTECEKFSDPHGSGRCYTITYFAESRLPEFIRRFWFYDYDTDHFMTEAEVVAYRPGTIDVSNIVAFSSGYPLQDWTGKQTRQLFVPYDNDKWVQYDVTPLSETVSYEVTALFDGGSREGWVVGSVEHDTWKTVVAMSANRKSGKLTGMDVVSGYTSELTRDVLPHGVVTGRRVASPKIFIGHFADWRDGMERYGSAVADFTPKLEWDGGTPFGYNSWGSIQEKVNLERMVQVSDFFRDSLSSFNYDNKPVYIGLDSYWDNFTDDELRRFADHCHNNGQRAGIYWAPFVDWIKDPERLIEGGNGLKYKDIYLYANNRTQELDGAWALDPTHPGTLARIDHFTDRFKRAGFEYIKIDFLTHASLEADSRYEKHITTGRQAYNFGMDYFRKAIGDDFYIAAAISPLFPSGHMHSRRIACDAFASIGDTEYTLNGLSYGWWLDRVYNYNDPDHLVLVSGDKPRTEGENRARVTSGIITGLMMLGDDFSASGPELAQRRALAVLNNRNMNSISAFGRSLRPLYGDRPSAGKRAENCFVLEYEGGYYLAVFNFTNRAQNHEIPVDSLGGWTVVEPKAWEMWREEHVEIKDNMLRIKIPPKDVMLLHLFRM